MIILLDTNILIDEPSLLAKKRKDILFATTKSVITELSIGSERYTGSQSISAIVDSAIAEGILQIHETNFPPDKEVYGYKLSPTDLDLLLHARQLREKDPEVAIATNDHDILEIATRYNIKTFNLHQIRALFSETNTDVSVNAKIKKQADTWSRKQIWRLIYSIVIAFIGGFSTNYIWSKIDKIISTISIWGTIFVVIIISVVMYAIRGRYRLIYGLFEFIFGFILIIRVFWPQFNYTALQPVDVLQIIGGLYIMVRGHDNIGTGLRRTKYESVWRKLSGEKL